ncbi:MAG: hypothetical protein KDE27_23205 [Planctomycetes bacterium]|nr:hypothetical protein [Planctomycetota bacterium]
MRSFRTVVFLFALLTAGGCFGRHNGGTTGGAGPSGPVAASVQGGGRVLLNPLVTVAVVLGAIVLTNELALGTANGDIRFRLQGNADAEPEVDEVVLSPGQSRQVIVRALAPTVAILTLAVIAEYVVGNTIRNFAVQWTNAAAVNDGFAMMALLGNPQLALLWFASAVLAPIGFLTRHSSNLVPDRLPYLRTEIRLLGAILLFFTLAELQASFQGAQDDEPAFPLGQGPNGYTLQAEPNLPLTQGDYCTFWLSVSEAIPLADPTQSYVYAFVVDTDANPNNNYVASPNFPNDFYAGTDRWYEASYSPATGWALTCKTVGAGNAIATVPSAARAVIRGDSLLLFVPRSEFGVDHPPFRATSFCHLGDYGLNTPHEWGGDPTPVVAEPLQAW